MLISKSKKENVIRIMKKAGLCVRYDCNNYGSMLQILATQRVINQIGWEYEIILYDKFTLGFYIRNLTRVFNPYFMKGKITAWKCNKKIKSYPEIAEQCKVRNGAIDKYRKKYIGPYSDIYKGYKRLVEGAHNYDAIVVGSDQLWTPAGIKSKFYNLLFVPDEIRKVSFATSFGVGEIPSAQKKLTAKYLERIEYLSVRELRGAKIIKELTGRDATVALDPTLLFSGEEWRTIFPANEYEGEPYIFAYFLGNKVEYRDVVDKLKEETGLKVVTIPFMDEFVERDLTFGDIRLFDVGPEDFLNYIRNATYICTDSFHGTVFSILNHKNFVTFNRTNSNDKQTRNSRIDSLFDLLGINERRYTGSTDVLEILEKKIDYNRVDSRLQELRNETLSFLKKALD